MSDMILNISEDKSSWNRMKALFEKLSESERMYVLAYTQGFCSGMAHEKRDENVHDENCSA